MGVIKAVVEERLDAVEKRTYVVTQHAVERTFDWLRKRLDAVADTKLPK